MTKAEIFHDINAGKAIHTGSVRMPIGSVQLDKWKLKDNSEYLVTSFGKLRSDHTLKNNPEYENERLQLLTLIE